MPFQCPLHNWFSWDFPCPACVTTVTSTDTDILPIAPQNFDFVERYVSNIPLDRVKGMQKFALDKLAKIEGEASATEDEITIIQLCGIIFELTQLNKDQQ